MLDLVTALLVLAALGVALSVPNAFAPRAIPISLRRFRNRAAALFVIAVFGCWIASVVVTKPVPRIHDEFSYLLIGETLSHGHVANAPPTLPEFFDTFHELVHPV